MTQPTATDTPLPDTLQQGLAASQQGHSEAAVDLFRQAWIENPADARAPFLAGSELAALGRIAEAEELMAAAALLAPGFGLARYQLGLLQWSQQRFSSAFLTWEPLRQAAQTPYANLIEGFTAWLAGDAASARKRFAAGVNQPGCSPAMAADIQRVLEAPAPAAAGPALPAQPAPTGVAATASAVAATDPAANPLDATAHVLMSAYTRTSSLH